MSWEVSKIPVTISSPEVAHRLSTETDGSYKPEKGLETLKNTRPCSVWTGLRALKSRRRRRLSVIPIRSVPVWDRVRTSLRAQLARYVTALANRGTVYDLSLIDKETDSQGNLVKDYSPTVASTSDFRDKHLGCSPTRYAPGSYQQFDQARV